MILAPHSKYSKIAAYSYSILIFIQRKRRGLHFVTRMCCLKAKVTIRRPREKPTTIEVEAFHILIKGFKSGQKHARK